MSFRAALLAALAVCAFAAPAHADDSALTDEQKSEVMDFAMHDALFTMYHESAHLLIHELGLPVLGKEEDAADALGVIEIFNNTADNDELYNTLNDVADGWYYSSFNMTDQDLETYDDHSLDIQRANAMVCMMVGADPGDFTNTADEYQMDADQQDACGGTYQQALDSWDSELKPHAASKSGVEIPVTYEPAGKYKAYADEIKSRHILEDVATILSSSFALPGPVSIRAAQCDEANAYYDPDTHQITYCYELAAQMYQLGADNLFAEDDQSSGDSAAQDQGDDPGATDTSPDGAKNIAGSKGG